MKNVWVTSLALCVALGAHVAQGQENTGISQQPLLAGGPADRGVRPYAAFLTLHSKNGTSHKCSGTLVSPTVILTAAHCIVCTQSVTAQIYGDVGLFENPPPGEAPATTYESASVAFNPAAYPSLPNCFDHDDANVFAELNKLTLWGADVAVVHLAQPVTSTTPAGVLLFPPRGFSPVQALYNQPLALVGRGFHSLSETTPPDGSHPDQENLKTMREGWTLISAFRNGLFSAENRNIPFGLVTSTTGLSDASALLGGDSGGPMLASDTGGTPGPAVIGVASASALALLSVHAPTFRLPNNAFLYQQLRGAPAPAAARQDEDGDGVADDVDNCRGTFNPDQMDRDDDAVGDLCDNCAPPDLSHVEQAMKPLDRFDGTPSSQYAPLRNAVQEDANGEAENEFLRSLNDGYLAHGEGREPNATEYFQHFRDGDASPFIVALKRIRRGNTCDPVPVAVPLVRTVPLPASAIVGGGFRSHTSNDWLVGEQISMPGEITISPLTDAASGPQPGAVGVRLCSCGGPRDTEAERRNNCGRGTPSNCAIDAGRYSLQDVAWRLLSLNGSAAQTDALVNATFATPRPSPKPVFQWDALADVARLTGLPLPPQPWKVGADGSIAGFPRLQGILWAHVDSYRGLPTQNSPTTPGQPGLGQLANAYLPVDIKPRWVVTSMKRVGFKPPPPWTYCPACEVLFETPWLWALDETPLVQLGGTIVDVAHAFTPAAERVLAGGDLRLGDKTGASTRMLVVNSKTLAVAGALFARGGHIEADEFPYGGPPARSTRRATTLAYSAVADRLYALSADKHGRTQLSTWCPASGWARAEEQPEGLGEPLAMLVTRGGDRLLVVDRRGRGDALRLVSVDPLTGTVTVVAEQLARARGAHVAITHGGAGKLLLALSHENRTELSHVELVAGRLRTVDRYTLDEALLGDVTEDGAGIHFVTLHADTPALHTVPPGGFQEYR